MGGLLENVKMYNNVAYNNSAWHQASSVTAAASIQVQPLHHPEVMNNTVYNNGRVGGEGVSPSEPAVEGIVIRNNICSQNLTLSNRRLNDRPGPGTITVDHNLIDGFRGYTDAGAAETRGSDYVEGDPKFVNAPGADFHLQASSPAIDKGSSLNAPSNDFEGNIRPQGAGYDIGAYESEGGPSPSETISTPATPTGEASGVIDTEYFFATGDAISSLDHPVEYRFDWGDGTLSEWSSSSEASKSWSLADDYPVRAQARCANHPSVESGWSDSFTVTISAAGPDLTGEWASLTQTCKRTKTGQKCTLKGTLTVSNIGNRDAASAYVDFYLSEDETFDEGDTPLKRSSTGTMKTSRSKGIKFSYNLPPGQTANYIIAVIDPDETITELDKENNIVVFGPIQ